jgi:hypothetical protein
LDSVLQGRVTTFTALPHSPGTLRTFLLLCVASGVTLLVLSMASTVLAVPLALLLLVWLA